MYVSAIQERIAVMNDIIWPENFPLLETERLLLRQVESDDADGLFECYSSPGVMKYISAPLERRDTIDGILNDYRDGYSDGCSLIWSVIVKKTGKFAGTAGFEEFNFLDTKADIGFSLLELYQGKGYMSEALETIINFGFQTMNINRIQTTVVPENQTSIKLLRNLNFQKEGHMRQSVFFSNCYHDELVFALLKQCGE